MTLTYTKVKPQKKTMIKTRNKRKIKPRANPAHLVPPAPNFQTKTKMPLKSTT